MFKKILVPTDGSDLSAKAIAGAIDYARLAGSKLIGMTVVDPYPFAPFGDGPVIVAQDLTDYIEQVARNHIVQFNQAAQSAGVEHEGVVVNSTAPWSAIIETAKSHGCDAIFMASHGRKGLNAVLLGSETHKVLIHTELPVTVFR